jgi:predicted N-acyltransferase
LAGDGVPALAIPFTAAGPAIMSCAPAAECILRIVRSICDVDAAAWERIAGENPVLSHGWLRVTEQEWREPVERSYLLLERAGRLQAAAACYVDAQGARAESVDDLLFGRLRGRLPGNLLSVRPALVCGFPWSLGSGCLVASDLGDAERSELTGALVRAVTDEAARQARTGVFLSVTAAEGLLRFRLLASGYHEARHEPIYVLNLDWPDFEAYRNSLESRSVRKNIRWEINKNRRCGGTIRALADPVGLEARLHAIVDSHFRRFGWAAFPYGPHWFRAIKSALGDDVVLSVALQDEYPVGVTVSIRKNGTRQLALVCVDHAREGGNFTYFNLAYYWGVADGIRAGDRRYIVGPGQHLSRTRRGYRPVDIYVYCRPNGALKRFSISLWLRLLAAWLRRKRPGRTALAGPDQSYRLEGSSRRTSSALQPLRRA